jgi:hypothetical protein
VPWGPTADVAATPRPASRPPGRLNRPAASPGRRLRTGSAPRSLQAKLKPAKSRRGPPGLTAAPRNAGAPGTPSGACRGPEGPDWRSAVADLNLRRGPGWSVSKAWAFYACDLHASPSSTGMSCTGWVSSTAHHNQLAEKVGAEGGGNARHPSSSGRVPPHVSPPRRRGGEGLHHTPYPISSRGGDRMPAPTPLGTEAVAPPHAIPSARSSIPSAH